MILLIIREWWKKNKENEIKTKLKPIEEFLAVELHKLTKSKKTKSSCNSEIDVLDVLAQTTLQFYCPKDSKPNEGQLDTTALKYILNECSIFDGWFDPKTKTGWFQSFHEVGKLRNDLHHD